MKHFKGLATTQLEGMEWGQDFVMRARSLESAQRRAEKNDWTHGDGVEQVEDVRLEEVTREEYQVLKKYLFVFTKPEPKEDEE